MYAADHRIGDARQGAEAIMTCDPSDVGLEDSHRRDPERFCCRLRAGAKDEGRGEVNDTGTEIVQDARDRSSPAKRHIDVRHPRELQRLHANDRYALDVIIEAEIGSDDDALPALRT